MAMDLVEELFQRLRDNMGTDDPPRAEEGYPEGPQGRAGEADRDAGMVAIVRLYARCTGSRQTPCLKWLCRNDSAFPGTKCNCNLYNAMERSSCSRSPCMPTSGDSMEGARKRD